MVSGASWLFFSPTIGMQELSTLQRKHLQYILVDRRLSTALPINGTYFESGEPNAGQHKEPLDLNLLEKFNWIPRVSRLFDSGDIVIYDLSYASDEPKIDRRK